MRQTEQRRQEPGSTKPLWVDKAPFFCGDRRRRPWKLKEVQGRGPGNKRGAIIGDDKDQFDFSKTERAVRDAGTYVGGGHVLPRSSAAAGTTVFRNRLISTSQSASAFSAFFWSFVRHCSLLSSNTNSTSSMLISSTARMKKFLFKNLSFANQSATEVASKSPESSVDVVPKAVVRPSAPVFGLSMRLSKRKAQTRNKGELFSEQKKTPKKTHEQWRCGRRRCLTPPFLGPTQNAAPRAVTVSENKSCMTFSVSLSLPAL